MRFPCWHHYLQLMTVSCHPLLESSPMFPMHDAFNFLPSFHHAFTFTGRVLERQQPCWGQVTLVEPHLWYIAFHCSSFALFSKLCRKLVPNWSNHDIKTTRYDQMVDTKNTCRAKNGTREITAGETSPILQTQQVPDTPPKQTSIRW